MIVQPILKVVPGNVCNLKCAYCYERAFHSDHQSQHQVMQREVLEKITREILEQQTQGVRFMWHGGEPLLAGVDFFKKALKYQAQYRRAGQVIQNSIQTNGTLLTPNWTQFFKTHGFRTGVSFDGPPTVHNSQRPFKDGRNSWKKVVEGIWSLRAACIPSGIICTVTNRTPPAREILRFFFSLGIKHIHFKALEATARKSDHLPPDKYADFMIEAFDFLLELDDPQIDITALTSFALGSLGGKPILCEHTQGCLSYISVEWDGSIGPCDLLYDYEPFGNITESSLQEILAGKKYQSFIRKVQNVSTQCKECQWWGRGCMGGCLRETSFDANGVRLPDRFCQARQKILAHMQKRFQEENINSL